MKLYVVHRTRDGYSRTDPKVSDVVGVFTDKELARKVAIASHGKYEEQSKDCAR